MGLDTTHGCWNGSYSSFGEWRRVIAKAAGFNLGRKKGFGGDDSFDDSDPLTALLNHSDCDGEIAVKDLLPLAEALEALLPVLERGYHERDEALSSYGLDFSGQTKKFIAGLRRAAAAGEPVEFH